MTIRFYSFPHSSGTRVHWALEELGVPYELVLLDAAKREHKTAEFLAINPNGKVPALVDDGIAHFESIAILLHLGETYGVDRGMWPDAGDRQARADAVAWLAWAYAELWAYTIQYIYHGCDTPMSYAPEQRSAAAAAYCLKHVEAQLDMLERRLADRDHVLGADFSIVDVPISNILIFARPMGVGFGERPKLRAYVDRCKARPALRRAK